MEKDGFLTVYPPTDEIPFIQEADEYQAFAMRTLSADYPAICARMIAGKIPDLLHASEGITTESGEFTDVLKKHIFYGKPLDVENMREEIGDLLWYIAIAAEALETSLSQLMTDNIRKLSKRYPGQFFSENAAIQRADKCGNDTTGGQQF